jgi:hypothetical protein
MNEKLRFGSRQHKWEALMGLIMFDLWFLKLIFKEIERISWYGVSFKLWLGLISDIGSLIEEWISMRI